VSTEPEIVDIAEEEDGGVRLSVPLHMLQGNMEVLVELGKKHEYLPCNGIYLIEQDRGVVLVISSSPEQKKLWRKVGFRSKPYRQ
jgi:hypothetical protein